MGTESILWKVLQSNRVYLSPSLVERRQSVSRKNDNNLDSLSMGCFTGQSGWLFER